MNIGDGDGATANELAVLDVCGHEYQHAVTEHTAGLIYAYADSGALNESFSDIFGCLIEFYSQADGRSAYPGKTPGRSDWLMGEDCWLASVALRATVNRAATGEPIGIPTWRCTRTTGCRTSSFIY